MPRKQFHFWIRDEQDLAEFLDSQPSIQKFILKILRDFKNGKLTYNDELDLKKKKLIVDIKYKEIQSKIKEMELEYWKTFGKSPSYSGEKAIKTAVSPKIPEGTNTESYEPPEEKKIEAIIQNSWNKFVDTIKQSKSNEWTLTCNLCSTGFVLPSRDAAIERFKKHLEETHYERLLEF